MKTRIAWALAVCVLGCNGRDDSHSTAATQRIARATSQAPAVTHGSSCEAGALTDARNTKPIPILDAPNGHTSFEIQNDSSGGDVWMLTLHERRDGHFRASVSTISDSTREGWIADRYVGVFARNYSSPLKLYDAPDTSSRVHAIVSDWSPDLYPVTGCAGRWLRVRANIGGKVSEGWMPPTMQCDNPYTTCS